MRKKSEYNLFVGLDIGTTKVAALVGSIGADKHIDVIGLGSHPSHGLKKGIVVNIDATVQSIKQAIAEAEMMAGCEIHSVYTGISGGHIRSLNSHGIVAIRDKEVAQTDIDRVIDAAKAVAIPADQKVLHVLPQEFIIDHQGGIREPIGMSGVRLEAKVHIVTGSVSSVQNIVKCIERCGLHFSDIILQPLASSSAVLTNDEKELGVCLVDIGGGTTDIAIFTEGAIRYSAVIPVAGDQVTNDIAVALRTPTKCAEEIKVKYASAMNHMANDDINIEVPSSAQQRQPREISRKFLVDVAGARYEELFNLVNVELKRSRFTEIIGSGVVLTGGASKIEGIGELAEQILGLPVRIGMPDNNIGGMIEVISNPVYSTGIGLLLAGFQRYRHGQGEPSMFSEPKSLLAKMRSWFQSNF
jgi:cell division protein FtsA